MQPGAQHGEGTRLGSGGTKRGWDRERMYRVTPRVRGTTDREEGGGGREEEAGGEGTSSWSNSQILKRPREEKRRVPR